MSKIKRIFIVAFATLIVIPGLPRLTQAQMGIGASYEVRNEVPENGFGVRLEKGIFNFLPVVDLGIRAHFSNFSAENQININEGDLNGLTYSRNVQDYDYGLTAVGGVNVGLFKPYVGLGLGSNTIKIQRDNFSESIPVTDESSESKVYWNALFGAEISALPVLKPFVEYRYTDVGKGFFRDLEEQGVPSPASSNGRWIFGVLLTF